MTIEAKIIADSVSPAGVRITTMQLRYPRFIHAELMTHRVFSRNASSSRAIPVSRLIADLKRDPATPVFWGGNQSGMQAAAELTEGELQDAKDAWLSAMEAAIGYARDMMEAGLHKQIANRILEPWAHMNTIVTATEWDNFFALRAHPDAQPEFHALALEMRKAMEASHPIQMVKDDWHLPYITANDWKPARELRQKNRVTRDMPSYKELVHEVLIKVSVARCARVSYLTHDGRETTVGEDLQLYDRLVGGRPIHASPAEHQATPDVYHETKGFDWEEGWEHEDQHGNFRGWIQYRKLIEDKFNG